VGVGQQRLLLRMPLPTDPLCDCVLYAVDEPRHDKVRHLWERLRRDALAQRRAPETAVLEDALEPAC
jgi:hypothetical protein